MGQPGVRCAYFETGLFISFRPIKMHGMSMPGNEKPMNVPHVAPFVTNLDRSIYCLKNLPEEVVAVLFAYYSRSTGSLRESLSRLITTDGLEWIAASGEDDASLSKAKEAARSFHEKWVVGYGHSSVAEHAVAHVAIEGCSILASKVIEDTRLASFTEKSTRYVWFDPEHFHTPGELDRRPTLRDEYQTTARQLMQTYISLSDKVLEQVRQDWPIQPEQPQKLWEAQTKAKACDLCRYLLPACTKTNVGVTLNGRLAEHLIRKLLSHPLLECRTMGTEVKSEVLKILPTLVKYADQNEYLAGRDQRVAEVVNSLFYSGKPLGGGAPAASDTAFEPTVRCVSHPADMVGDLASAILYEHRHEDGAAIHDQATKLSKPDQLALIQAYLAGRERHDQPGRALEHVNLTFDILVDYGAFRDIQRHRMCTQTHQTLTCIHGYCLPPELERYGHAGVFHAAMQQAQKTHAALVEQVGPMVASYMVPLAYRKRTLYAWNLRELWHFISLRSGKQGHASYRKVAQACWRELERICPDLARLVPVDMNDYALGRSGKETVQSV